MRATRWLAIGVLSASAVGWGCGGDVEPPPVPSEEAKVTGSVTIRGKPAKGGEIVFAPVVAQGQSVEPRAAKIGPDGSYTVRAFVGKNAVMVRGPAILKDAALAENQTDVEVKPGENSIPISLLP